LLDDCAFHAICKWQSCYQINHQRVWKAIVKDLCCIYIINYNLICRPWC